MAEVIAVTYSDLKYSSSPLSTILIDMLPEDAKYNEHARYYVKLELIGSDRIPTVHI